MLSRTFFHSNLFPSTLQLSCRQKATISSAVGKAAGISFHDTNIYIANAWWKGKERKTETSSKIKEDIEAEGSYEVIEMLCLMCLVYLNGISDQASRCSRDILRGTGQAQKNAVTELLEEWEIFDEVVGQVFELVFLLRSTW